MDLAQAFSMLGQGQEGYFFGKWIGAIAGVESRLSISHAETRRSRREKREGCHTHKYQESMFDPIAPFQSIGLITFGIPESVKSFSLRV